MACHTCHILSSVKFFSFPGKKIALRVHIYAIGILESPEDFESSAELYDAVGGMILGVAASGSEEGELEEDSVRWICDQLFSAMQGLGYRVCGCMCV